MNCPKRCMVTTHPHVLFELLNTWLELKDVIRFDSACCARSSRTQFLKVIAMSSLRDLPAVTKNVDGYVHWRVLRKISKPLMKLTVSSVCGPYTTNRALGEGALNFLKELTVYKNIDDDDDDINIRKWFKLVVPYCQKLNIIDASCLSLKDFEWLRALATSAAPVTELTLTFRKQFDYRSPPPSPLMPLLAAFNKLKSVEVCGYHCLGLEALLYKNQNLVSVKLESCKYMSEDCFALLFSLPRLEYIELAKNNTMIGTGNFNITSTAIWHFWLHQFTALTGLNLLRLLTAIPNKPKARVDLELCKHLLRTFTKDNEELLKQFQTIGCYDLDGWCVWSHRPQL